MTGEHEGRENLSERTKDLERARQSMIEEIEAINWYEERVDATKDEELKKILQHNANEEKEHMAMLLEWVRKHDKAMAKELEDNLNKDVVKNIEEEH